MGTLTLDRDEIVRLAALATGDEKHEASSYSTLDALLVLYGRVLQVDPADPAWEQRDRFILSKGHAAAALYVAGAAETFGRAAELAEAALRDGAAHAALERLRRAAPRAVSTSG